MTAAINSTGAGKRGYPTKSSVPETQASTQRRARERSVAIQTLLLVRKSKSSSVKSKTAEAGMSLIEAKAVWKRTDCSVTCFFFNDTATTEIYTLSLHDALPI